MLKSVPIVLATALIAVPAMAASTGRPLDFERDGIHYVGKVIDQPNGATRIVGQEVQSGRDFVLFVSNGRVTGRFGGTAVSYPVPTRSPGAEIAATND